MQQVVNRKAPAKSRVPRLTAEMRNLKVSARTALRLDEPTCKALRVYAKAQGWKVTQLKQEDGSILFWRVG